MRRGQTYQVLGRDEDARWSLILAHKEVDVFRSQVVGLVTVAVLGLSVVPRYAETGAAAAALGGGLGVWVSSYVLSWYRKVETPPLMLAVKPLVLAGLLAIGTTLVALPPFAEAAGVLLVYAIVAPVIDRSLWSDVRHLARAGHIAQ